MALTDKDILITPNDGSASANPKIEFTGADANGNDTITVDTQYDGSITTLSYEGSAGQLFSISNDLTGTLFAVNDSSGVPSLEIDNNGEIKLSEFDGTVTVGNTGATPLSGIFGGRLIVKGSGDQDPIIAVTDSASANSAAGVFHQSSSAPGFPALLVNANSNANSQAIISAKTNVSNTTGAGGTEVFKVTGQGALTITGQLTASTINTGQGATEVHLMNQNVRTTDSPTFATVNTGQGATEVHLMNQNVRTTDSPTFDELTVTDFVKATGNNLRLSAGGTHVLNIDLNGKIYPNTHNAYDIGFNSSTAFRHAYFSGTGNFANINTGQGATEVHLMNQNVRTSDSPTFQDLTVQGNLSITGDINSYNVTDLDVTDKTITVGAGQTEANSGGSGLIVDGSGASLLWDEADNYWAMNKKLAFDSTPTTTNQGLGIIWTGFDKEGTTDFSDSASIYHTTNTGGHGGAVLLISSMNDSGDGIAFSTHGSSYLKHNSSEIITAANYSTFITSVSNADTVDNLHAASFIRSDADDTATGTYTFSNSANHFNGHIYYDAYDANGNHYPHYLSGSSNNGAQINLRVQQSGGTGYDVLYIPNGSNNITWRGNKVWNAGNDGSGSGLDADLLDGYNTSTTATANTVVVREANGHIYGNYILGTYFNAGSGNSENPTIGQVWTQSTSDNYLRKSTPAHFKSQLGLWHTGNDGSGSGLDADMVDGYHKADINPAHSHYRWTGISASGTQARRFVIMRLYGCPAHWDSNWQDIHLKVWSEGYEATNLKYELCGDYNGGNQNTMFQLRLKDAGGSSEHGRFRLVLGTPVDAGWDHSGQNTYYVDVYAEASHYMNFTVAADFYSAGFNVNTLPTSGGATSVVYSSPAVSNITTFAEAKEHSYFANHKIWNDGNHGSASGLDADLLDGQHGSYYYAASNPNGYTSNVGDITAVTAGNGLTGGATSGVATVNVGAGDGISVTANTVTVNSTVVRTTGNQSISGVKTHTNTLALSAGQMLSLGDANHHLIKVTTGYSGVTVDGPRLQGHQGGELATNISSNQYALRWDASGNITVRNNIQALNDIILGTYNSTNTGTLYLTGSTANKQATLKCTNGNLHMDGNTGNSMYLNYYAGTSVHFGTGAGGVGAVMGPDGDLWKGSSDNSGSKYWHAGNDGSGSGLDADLLDGQHGSYYQNATNITSGTLNNARLTDLFKAGNEIPNAVNLNSYRTTGYYSQNSNAQAATGSNYPHAQAGLLEVITDDTGNGLHTLQRWARYNNNDTFNRYYYNGTWTSWRKEWNSLNDGSGSGLDADLLDGQQGSHYLNYNNLTNKPSIPSLSGYATEAYVGTQISNLVDSSPSALNTLNELAAAIGDDANFSTTVTNNIATKLSKAGGTMTGDITMGGNDVLGASLITLNANPTGTSYGGTSSATPANMISQVVGSNDGWRLYGEGASNDVKMIFEVIDDNETGDTWVFRNKKTYSPYTSTEDFKITGEGDIYARRNGYVNSNQRVFADNYHPNADKWTTARSHTVTLTGDVTGTASQNVDGTGNKTWSITTAVGNNSHIHDHIQGGNVVGTNLNTIASQANSGELHYDSFSTSAANKPPTSDNANGVITVGQHSGNYTAQLAFSSNGFMYHRDNPNNSYGSWNKVFQDNYHPNADTLTTARTIAGTSFDGSANIDINYDNLTNKPTNISNSDTVDGIHAASFLRSDTLDVMQYNTTSGEMLKFANSTSGGKIQIGFQQNDSDGMHHRFYIKAYKGSGSASGKVDLIVRGSGGATTTDVLELHSSNSAKWRTNTLWDSGNDGSGSGLDADTVDGKHKDFLMHYKGQVSGNWDTIFSQTDGHMGVYQVENISNTDSNYPSGAYTYGGVMSWQLADSTFKLYAPHTGQLHYQTGWNNDEYSGWRKIWDSGNDGAGSGLDADLLDGQQGSFYRNASNIDAGTLPIARLPSPLNSSQAHAVTGSAFATTGSPGSVLEYQQASGQSDTKLAPSGDWYNTIRMGHGNPYSYYSNTIAMRMTGSNDGTMFTQHIHNNTAQGWRQQWDSGNDGAGSGLDADTVDGIQASNFLRSDGNDTTTGRLSINDGVQLTYGAGGIRFGGTANVHMRALSTNANSKIDFSSGSISVGTNTVFHQGNDGSGSGLDADTLDGTQKSEFLYDLGSGDFRHDPGGAVGNVSLGHVPTSGIGSAYIVTQKQTNAGQPGSILYYISPTGTTNSSTYMKFKMEHDGDFHADGDVIAYSTTTGSDRKLKKNIRDLEGSLDKTLKLRGVKYDWKDENKDNNQLGFIAQEVEEVLPEVVKEVETLGKDSTHLTVNYPAVVPLLVEAIKEQQAIINKLEARINALEKIEE